MTKKAKAVVLLSGGMDSAVTLAISVSEGFDCYALSCRYGQRHLVELAAAKRLAQALGTAEHKVINIDPVVFKRSALTDKDIKVPKNRRKLGRNGEVPATYVPARNTIFLSYALAWAEALGAFDIFIGVNAVDYSGYPDCRGEFITAFEKMANLATVAAVSGEGRYLIHTPIIGMTKGQIILRGARLGVDFSLTHSCYDPGKRGQACGRCDACRLRLKGFKEAGIKDVIKYKAQRET